MKDLRERKVFLRMRVTRDRQNKIITIDQSEYIEKVLERFNMKESKPKNTPMGTRKVQKRMTEMSQNREIYIPNIPYREVVGSRFHLAGAPRPDIAYTVNILSRSQTKTTFRNWKGVKRMLRYLRGTTNVALTFRGNTDALEANRDSSHRD